jgi:hypothetical protein
MRVDAHDNKHSLVRDRHLERHVLNSGDMPPHGKQNGRAYKGPGRCQLLRSFRS